jgi:hypothetical protein
MRTWLAIVCGVFFVILALIIEAPATLLEGRLAAISGGRAHVSNTSGTLWRGAGELVLDDGVRRRIAWRLDPWALLRGEVRGTLAGDGAAPDARFAVGRDRLELDGVALAMPIAALQRAAGASSMLANASGEVAIRVDRLVRDADAIDVQLALQWRDASISGPGTPSRIALGDIQVEMSGRGAEVSGPIANRGGEVEIDGKVTASANGRTRLEANIRPRPGIDKAHADAIAKALSTVGIPDAQGGYRVAWSGGTR